MESTYIARYERNLIENAHKEGMEKGIKDTKKDLARKMKADGVSSDFIFKYCGIIL